MRKQVDTHTNANAKCQTSSLDNERAPRAAEPDTGAAKTHLASMRAGPRAWLLVLAAGLAAGQGEFRRREHKSGPHWVWARSGSGSGPASRRRGPVCLRATIGAPGHQTRRAINCATTTTLPSAGQLRLAAGSQLV